MTEARDYDTDVPADIDGVYGPITRDMLLWRLASGDGCWFYWMRSSEAGWNADVRPSESDHLTNVQ